MSGLRLVPRPEPELCLECDRPNCGHDFIPFSTRMALAGDQKAIAGLVLHNIQLWEEIQNLREQLGEEPNRQCPRRIRFWKERVGQ